MWQALRRVWRLGQPKPVKAVFSAYQGTMEAQSLALMGRKMLVRTMIQEAGCDVGTKRIVWVKINLDYEILFRLMDGLHPDEERHYWIREPGAEGKIDDIGEDMGQMETEVKIAFPVSYNILTEVEQHVQ